MNETRERWESDPEVAQHSNERMMFFSDGIFAITVTLLILEIKVPEIPENLISTELHNALLHLIPNFLAYVLSFLILGIYWIAHHNIFMYIKHHDHVMLWLNTVFMMCVAAVPFPTALLSRYPNQQISLITYASILVVTGVMLDLIWWYATTHRLVEADTDPRFVSFVHFFNRIAPFFYLLSIFISFVSLTLAKFLIIAVAIFYIVPNPLYRSHYRHLFRRLDQ